MSNFQKFKDTMSFSSHGVSLFSIKPRDNHILGTTITSFMSVSTEPNCFLFCLNQNLKVNNHLDVKSLINIHFLNSKQQYIAEIFSNKRDVDAYKDLFTLDESNNERLFLKDSIVDIFAQIRSISPIGSHNIYICEVINSDINEYVSYNPLIYYNRKYTSVK
ncbi:flavin reductase family protein [Acinetobacter baumannii]